MKVIIIVLVFMILAACTGQLRPYSSVTIGPQGGAVSGTLSGPGGSATVTVPVK